MKTLFKRAQRATIALCAFRALALVVCALLSAGGAFAQKTALLPIPHQQFFDSNGYPLAGGFVYTCVAGSTCPGTPLASYTDSTGNTANANPVVLDAGGFGSIWLSPAPYKIVVENPSGVVISTTDNVTGSNATGYNVKTYGAKGDDVTDDTAAIAAACTAAGTGQLVFPPATYKITAGGISTCSPGVQILGYGATLDLTSLTGTMFSFNVGGPIVSSAPTTLIAGFHVTGSQLNLSTTLVRADNVYSVTVRDIYTSSLASIAQFNGSSYYSLVEDSTATGTVFNTGTAAVIYGLVSYGSSQVAVGAKISNLGCYQLEQCVVVDAGDVDIDRSTWSDIGAALQINFGRAALRNSQVTLRSDNSNWTSEQAVLIANTITSSTLIENDLINFVGAGSDSMMGIQNNSTADIVISGTFNIASTGTGAAIVYYAAASNRLLMNKTKVLQTTSNGGGGIFAFSTSSVTISGAISGSEFTNTGSGSMNFVASGSAAGGFANVMFSGNYFTGLTSLTNIGSLDLRRQLLRGAVGRGERGAHLDYDRDGGQHLFRDSDDVGLASAGRLHGQHQLRLQLKLNARRRRKRTGTLKARRSSFFGCFLRSLLESACFGCSTTGRRRRSALGAAARRSGPLAR